jgi:hypothetical protein
MTKQTAIFSGYAIAVGPKNWGAALLMRVPVESDHGFRWKMIAQSGGT